MTGGLQGYSRDKIRVFQKIKELFLPIMVQIASQQHVVLRSYRRIFEENVRF